MSELEDILNYLETTSLEPHDDYVSEFSYKNQKTLWKYIKDLRLKNQELKKQIEEYIRTEMKIKDELESQRKEYQETYKDVREEIKEYKNQQIEFIEYLEDYIEVLKSQQENVNGLDILEEETLFILEETLEKYKEIIGGKDE